MSKSQVISLEDKQNRVAVNLYRLTLWADTLRMQFESSLARDREELERRRRTKQFILDAKAIESDMYIHLWFGVLNTVIEGWPQLQLKHNQPPRISELLKSPFKDLLRNFRNATFHPEDFDDSRILDLVSTGQESIDWARKLTLEFRLFCESLIFSRKDIEEI